MTNKEFNLTKEQKEALKIEDTIKFAEWIHNSYEHIAKQEGWKTQENCKVDFKDLPKKNQVVMIRVAERIKIQFNMFFDKIIDERLKDMIASNIVEDELLKLKQNIRKKLRIKVKKQVNFGELKTLKDLK